MYVPLIIIWLLSAIFRSTFAQIGVQNGNWGLQTDGTYRNPIIAGDYTDTDLLVENGIYYLISDTVWWSPGIIILKSTDLINWESYATVIPNITATFNNDKSYDWSGMNQYKDGIWAPAIRKHNETYYIYFNAWKTGFYVSTAQNIKGPWTTRPLLDMIGRPLLTGAGWDDPCPIWTDDGKAYLVASKPGGAWYPHLFQMSPDGTKLLDGNLTTMKSFGVFASGDGTVIQNTRSSEGNKYYYWNGYHYFWQTQLIPGSRWRGGFLMRSKNIYGTLANGKPGGPGNAGTYERKQVINPGGSAGARDPTQGAILQTPCGEWYDPLKKFAGLAYIARWYVTQLGTAGPEGRPVALLPVTWNSTDGFPILGTNPINGAGQMNWNGGKLPCTAKASTPEVFPQGSDNFSSTTLGPRWSWDYQPRPGFWSLTENPGYMRLKAFKQLIAGNFEKTGNMLFQRYFRSISTRMTAKISFAHFATGQVGGIAHWAPGLSYAALQILMPLNSNSPVVLYSATGSANATFTIPSGTTTAWFRSEIAYDSTQNFSYSWDGATYHPVGNKYALLSDDIRGNPIAFFTYNNHQEAGMMDIDNFEYCFNHGLGSKCPE